MWSNDTALSQALPYKMPQLTEPSFKDAQLSVFQRGKQRERGFLRTEKW